jgi:hypothetical protein
MVTGWISNVWIDNKLCNDSMNVLQVGCASYLVFPLPSSSVVHLRSASRWSCRRGLASGPLWPDSSVAASSLLLMLKLVVGLGLARPLAVGLARLVLRSAGLMPLIDPPALPPAPHLPALSPVLPPPLLRLALSCFSRFTIPESQLVYAVIPRRVRRQQ